MKIFSWYLEPQQSLELSIEHSCLFSKHHHVFFWGIFLVVFPVPLCSAQDVGCPWTMVAHAVGQAVDPRCGRRSLRTEDGAKSPDASATEATATTNQHRKQRMVQDPDIYWKNIGCFKIEKTCTEVVSQARNRLNKDLSSWHL